MRRVGVANAGCVASILPGATPAQLREIAALLIDHAETLERAARAAETKP